MIDFPVSLPLWLLAVLLNAWLTSAALHPFQGDLGIGPDSCILVRDHHMGKPK